MTRSFGVTFVVATAVMLGCSSSDPGGEADASGTEPVDEGELSLRGGRAGGGTPQGRCPDGFTNCRGKCVLLSADENNCGACGVICPGGWDCCNGTCTAPGAFQGDTANCGSCGHACDAGDLCCDGACVPDDPSNCGACGHACGSNERCCAGECLCGTSCDVAETCGTGAFCDTQQCVCGIGVKCGGNCVYCMNSEVLDTGTCTCRCPLDENSCGTGLTFDPESCSCVCDDSSTFDCGTQLCCRSGAQSCAFQPEPHCVDL